VRLDRTCRKIYATGPFHNWILGLHGVRGRIMNHGSWSYRVVKGLYGSNSVSFQDCATGQYLRHASYWMWRHAYSSQTLYRKDASWYLVKTATGYNFRSVNYAHMNMRHQGYWTKISVANTMHPAYDDDWRFVPALPETKPPVPFKAWWTPYRGGGGGRSLTSVCPKGEYIKYWYVRTGSLVDSIQGRCSGGRVLAKCGGNGGRAWGWRGTRNKHSDVVRTGSLVDHFQGLGGRGGGAYNLNCGSGVISGYHMRCGSLVDGLKFYCTQTGHPKPPTRTPVRSASKYTLALAKGRGKFDILCDDTAGRHWNRLATGNGNFGGSKHYLSGWCSHSGSKTNWADINGDGRADLLCDDSRGNHWYKLATGNGNFGASRHYLAGWCGHGGSYTQWADINGDGKADLLCDDTAGRHWVKLSHGNGHFSRGRHYMSGWCGHHGSRTNWADINGDGRADILCDDSAGRHWYRLSRGGEGHFDGGRHYKSGWCSHSGSKTNWADINGDGKADLLCDDRHGRHWYMLSSGNGHFGHSRHYLSGWCGHGGSYTQWADINGDGKSDLLCDDTAGRHWFKLATGSGNFGHSKHYMSGWCGHGGSRTNWADIDGK